MFNQLGDSERKRRRRPMTMKRSLHFLSCDRTPIAQTGRHHKRESQRERNKRNNRSRIGAAAFTFDWPRARTAKDAGPLAEGYAVLFFLVFLLFGEVFFIICVRLFGSLISRARAPLCQLGMPLAGLWSTARPTSRAASLCYWPSPTSFVTDKADRTDNKTERNKRFLFNRPLRRCDSAKVRPLFVLSSSSRGFRHHRLCTTLRLCFLFIFPTPNVPSPTLVTGTPRWRWGGRNRKTSGKQVPFVFCFFPVGHTLRLSLSSVQWKWENPQRLVYCRHRLAPDRETTPPRSCHVRKKNTPRPSAEPVISTEKKGKLSVRLLRRETRAANRLVWRVVNSVRGSDAERFSRTEERRRGEVPNRSGTKQNESLLHKQKNEPPTREVCKKTKQKGNARCGIAPFSSQRRRSAKSTTGP